MNMVCQDLTDIILPLQPIALDSRGRFLGHNREVCRYGREVIVAG